MGLGLACQPLKELDLCINLRNDKSSVQFSNATLMLIRCVCISDSGRSSIILQLSEAGVSIKDTLVLSNTEVKIIWQVSQV